MIACVLYTAVYFTTNIVSALLAHLWQFLPRLERGNLCAYGTCILTAWILLDAYWLMRYSVEKRFSDIILSILKSNIFRTDFKELRTKRFFNFIGST